MSTVAEPLLAPLVDRLDQMVKDIPGWSPVDQLYTLNLLGLATAHLPGDFLEIGSWCGRSAVVLGSAARMLGNTQVHCIDLFPRLSDWKSNADGDRYLEVEINGKLYRANQEQTVWAQAFGTQVSKIYLDYESPRVCLEKQIQRLDLGKIIRLHRGTSATFEAARAANFQCKLAFIDGDHGYDAVCQDIAMVKNVLVGGGWICFDDAFSSYEWVNRAIREQILGDPQFDFCQQMTRKLFVARKKPEASPPTRENAR